MAAIQLKEVEAHDVEVLKKILDCVAQKLANVDPEALATALRTDVPTGQDDDRTFFWRALAALDELDQLLDERVKEADEE